MTPMTDEEYVAADGMRCPFCGEENTMDGGQVAVENGQATQEVFCRHCNGKWEDIYDLVGYDVVQFGAFQNVHK